MKVYPAVVSQMDKSSTLSVSSSTPRPTWQQRRSTRRASRRWRGSTRRWGTSLVSWATPISLSNSSETSSGSQASPTTSPTCLYVTIFRKDPKNFYKSAQELLDDVQETLTSKIEPKLLSVFYKKPSTKLVIKGKAITKFDFQSCERTLSDQLIKFYMFWNVNQNEWEWILRFNINSKSILLQSFGILKSLTAVWFLSFWQKQKKLTLHKAYQDTVFLRS